VLDRPCPNGNAITYELCKSLCRQLLDQEAETMPDLPQLVRSLCLESETGIPHANDVADQLGMSLRTLHRKLAGSGFTFLDIANDVRRRRAIQLLENTSLSMEQVAERTGFSDAASFRRSFRKWTGQAPKAYRAAT
jgi:AraC-like DNA-binding protein